MGLNECNWPCVCTYPEEEDWVAVAEAEAVTVADVMTTTDEGADTPATSATVVGVEGGDVCCCATVTGADEVDGAAEVDPVDGEGVLWSVSGRAVMDEGDVRRWGGGGRGGGR
jgi:hypothetical protein